MGDKRKANEVGIHFTFMGGRLTADNEKDRIDSYLVPRSKSLTNNKLQNLSFYLHFFMLDGSGLFFTCGCVELLVFKSPKF